MLARKLQELRKERGLSQLRLAHLAGVSQSNISEIEAGKIIPRVPTLRRLAAALGVQLSVLIDSIDFSDETTTGAPPEAGRKIG